MPERPADPGVIVIGDPNDPAAELEAMAFSLATGIGAIVDPREFRAMVARHAAEVRAAAIREAANAAEAWNGDETPEEDRPGYDGPTIDPEDRLRTAIDPELPAGLREKLIAEHRQMVTDEIAAELRRLAAAPTTTPTPEEH